MNKISKLQLDQWKQNPITKLFIESLGDKLEDVNELALDEIGQYDNEELLKQINMRRGYKMAIQDLTVEVEHTLDAYGYIESEEDEKEDD